MGLFKAAVAALTEPRESKGFIMRWDCPFCEDLFRSAEAAAEHTENCKGK